MKDPHSNPQPPSPEGDPAPCSAAAPASADAHSSATARPSGLVTAALGFLTGILFWHSVGFWSFVSGIAFNQREHTPLVVETGKSPERLIAADGELAAAPSGTAADQNCAALALHRTTGEVRVLPCHWLPTVHAQGTAAARGDLALADVIESRLSARLGIDPRQIETGSITQPD